MEAVFCGELNPVKNKTIIGLKFSYVLKIGIL